MSLNDFPTFDCNQTNLKLSTQFYQLLTDRSNYVLKRIRILPKKIVDENPDIQEIIRQTGLEVASVNDDLTGYHEVVISDSTMMKMFIECYCALYLKPIPMEQTLIPAIVILLVTPNDTTTIKKLWQRIRSLNNKIQVLSIFFILGGYLSCNYDKTNKSSCLWNLFKKLLIKLKNDEFSYCSDVNLKIKLSQCDSASFDNNLLYYSIKVCLRSVSEHPRNYYATSALRFFLKRYKHENNEELYLEITKQVSIMNYDLSLWKVICDCLLLTPKSIDCRCQENSQPCGFCIGKKKISPRLVDMILSYGSEQLFTYLLLLLSDGGEDLVNSVENMDVKTLKETIKKLLIK